MHRRPLWVPTDAVIREAHMDEREREAVLGALKVLVVLGVAEWTRETRRIVSWRWVAQDGGGA